MTLDDLVRYAPLLAALAALLTLAVSILTYRRNRPQIKVKLDEVAFSKSVNEDGCPQSVSLRVELINITSNKALVSEVGAIWRNRLPRGRKGTSHLKSLFKDKGLSLIHI